MTKKEIIELYLADLNNLLPDSDAKRSMIIDLKNELEVLGIHDVMRSTDLEWSLYKQVVELKEKVKKLEFMIENGLGWEDMRNDISMPHEL